MEKTWKTYYENGQLKEEIPLRGGRLNGVGLLYDKKGNLVEKRIYANDMLMGNPYDGIGPSQLAEELGLTPSDPVEWDLAETEEGEMMEVTPKMLSVILLE